MFNLTNIHSSSLHNGKIIIVTAEDFVVEFVIQSSVPERSHLLHLPRKYYSSRTCPVRLLWVQKLEVPHARLEQSLHARVAPVEVSSSCGGNPVAKRAKCSDVPVQIRAQNPASVFQIPKGSGDSV